MPSEVGLCAEEGPPFTRSRRVGGGPRWPMRENAALESHKSSSAAQFEI